MNFGKARLSQAEVDHEVQGDRMCRGKDRENTTDTRGENKFVLQDITKKFKDVNCMERKTWSGTRISSRRRSSRT